MEVTALQLFALLRAALWKEEVDVSLFKGAVDWKAVSALAFRQTVLGLLYEGIMRLPQEYRPERALILKLHSWCVQTVQRHHLLNEVWKEIAGRLEGEQIHCVLLKGQGLAANYPEPLRRACGDAGDSPHYGGDVSLADKPGFSGVERCAAAGTRLPDNGGRRKDGVPASGAF